MCLVEKTKDGKKINFYVIFFITIFIALLSAFLWAATGIFQEKSSTIQEIVLAYLSLSLIIAILGCSCFYQLPCHREEKNTSIDNLLKRLFWSWIAICLGILILTSIGWFEYELWKFIFY